MRKILTLAAALLASFSLWAGTDVTFSAEEIAAGTVKSNVTPHCSLSTSSNYICESSKVTLIQNGNSADAAYNDDGKRIAFSVAAGKGTISKIVVHGSTNSTTAYNAGIVCWDDIAFPTTAIGSTTLQLPGYVQTGSCDGYDVEAALIDGTKAVAIYKRVKYTAATNTVGAGSNLGDGQTIRISEVTLTIEPECTSPDEALSITSDAPAALYEGSTIHLTLAGGNGAAKHLQLDGVDFEYLTWMAEAGEHTFTVSQDAYDGYCPQEAELKLNVLSATPVSAVAIDGPASGFIGAELVYTATAANATAYEWYLDGAKQGSDSAKFIYTAVKGEHSIVCKARNDFNETDEWIASDPIALNVTKLCGELIAFTAETGSNNIDKDITVAGGTAHQKTDKNGKIGGTGYYVSLRLANGSFMAGDTVHVVSSTAYAKLHLFSDQGTNSIAEKETPTNNDYVVLEKGATTIYLYRNSTDGSNMNPTVTSISVTRACEDSNDATIHSLTVNGNEVAENEGLFEYTLSASYEEPTVTIAFEIHPLATIKYDLSNPYELTTPDVGDSRGQAFTIIAEDGTEKTYTVQIYKSASLSNDATLKELSVAGLTLDPAFAADVTEYTVTKAYEAAMPEVSAVTATPNSSDAKGAEVTITGNVITIVVTAENDDTKTYTITVNNAEALKSLSQVKFANGFDAFIDNTNHTVKAFYLAGEAAPEATAIVAGNGTAGPLSEGKIVVTGADDSQVEYTVTLEEVTPNTDVVAATADAGAFDGTETWVKGGLHISDPGTGFTDGKYILRRQLKSGDAANDQRVIAGFVRAYFFVGNASKFELTQTSNKGVKYSVDGGEPVEAGDAISITLEEGNHMIEIVTNQSKGNCELSAPKLIERTATAISNTEAEVKAVKFIENGQFFIIKNGIKYNANGAIVK